MTQLTPLHQAIGRLLRAPRRMPHRLARPPTQTTSLPLSPCESIYTHGVTTSSWSTMADQAMSTCHAQEMDSATAMVQAVDPHSGLSLHPQSATSSGHFRFEVVHTSRRSRARVGRIHTPHGVIDTPAFVPVGTTGTLKCVDHTIVQPSRSGTSPSHEGGVQDKGPLDVDLMFMNTYHLLVHPGPDIVAGAGGLHQFTGRTGPIITDSGGFQVFSLSQGGKHVVTDSIRQPSTSSSSGSRGGGELKKGHGGSSLYNNSARIVRVDEDGVLFTSYRDGARILLTPETSVDAQKKLRADIIIPFDELLPFHTDPRQVLRSLERTHRWQVRSLARHLQDGRQQAMYAVIHGGLDMDLRTLSASFLSSLPFDGMAIGGSLGRLRQDMWDMLPQVTSLLPASRPVHLLGIGDPESICHTVGAGIDSFDSSYPTKLGRHATLLTAASTPDILAGSVSGRRAGINIKQGKYKELHQPVDDTCPCPTCQHYTVSYLHHLFKMNEPVAPQLASVHNLAQMNRLMRQLRDDIMHDRI